MVQIERVTGDGPVLKVLHLHLEIGEQSEANQFVLPARHEVSVVTFFPCRIRLPARNRLFDGDGTFLGFRRALKAAREAGPFDVVHAHGPIDAMLYLLFAHWVGGSLGKTVYTAHHSFTNSNFKRRNRILSIPVFRFYERVVCVGKASMESFPPLFHKLSSGRLSAVPNGVNLQRLDASLAEAATSREDDRFTVASVGRLIDIKNPFTVVEAFAGIPEDDSELLFVGNGALEESLRERLEALGDSRIKMTGEIGREEVYRLLDGRADLFVSASRGEGMPMAPLEAMACGCPVVLSDIGPHREIADGVDFIPLVDPDDTEGFRREIQRFRALSGPERRDIGLRCRAVVEEGFSLQKMHEGYDAVYYDVLGAETAVVETGTIVPSQVEPTTPTSPNGR